MMAEASRTLLLRSPVVIDGTVIPAGEPIIFRGIDGDRYIYEPFAIPGMVLSISEHGVQCSGCGTWPTLRPNPEPPEMRQ